MKRHFFIVLAMEILLLTACNKETNKNPTNTLPTPNIVGIGRVLAWGW